MTTPPDTVRILTRSNTEGDPSGWPVVGAETLSLRSAPAFPRGVEGDRVVAEAGEILRHCVRPGDLVSPSRVGLVTGYVQSGKTSNYIALAALARDNGYAVVIVITGISTNLFGQSTTRIQEGLRIDMREDRPWLPIAIDTRAALPDRRISESLAEWHDVRVRPEQRRTLLITVMKNHRNLDFLTRALRNAPDLQQTVALIIDDEGDQASLNYLAAQNRESTTYRQIAEVRRLVPHHTYLQYTATPQAPLLINLIDALSPVFVEVLTPGTDYTGGQTFFAAAQQLIRTVPQAEIITPQNPLASPPPSYMRALATFYVGVAAGRLRDGARGNRSMLVHPHQTRTRHDIYFTWARSLKDMWMDVFNGGGAPESRDDVVTLFESVHAELAQTVPADALPPWAEIRDQLPLAIRSTDILEVNAARGATPAVPWRDHYAHILVGGQAMDRGFTVEGLTVTYMPRAAGDGNADTVQQRARFFGYKRAYLGFCRVWLEPQVRDLFRDYVEHEEDIRGRLMEVRDQHQDLRQWKRAFFLASALRPTRRQVITLPYMRGNDRERWVDPQYPHALAEVVQANNAVVDAYIQTLATEEWRVDARFTDYQRHRVARSVLLRTLYEQLLQELRMADPEDSLRHTALLLQLAAGLEARPDLMADVYIMRPAVATVQRTLGDDDELVNFYQGANPSVGPNQGSIYPGDREVRSDSDLTVQLHEFDLASRDGQRRYPRVHVVATHVPRQLGRDWLVQS